MNDPVACPYGTYNDGVNATNASDCLVCPQRHKTNSATGATECVYDTGAFIATCVILGILGCVTLTNWVLWALCPGCFCCHQEDDPCMDKEGKVAACCTWLWINVVMSAGYMIFLGVWFNTKASWNEPYMGGYSVHSKAAHEKGNNAEYWFLDVLLVLLALTCGQICLWLYCSFQACSCCGIHREKGECCCHDAVLQDAAMARVWYSTSVWGLFCPVGLLTIIAGSMLAMESSGLSEGPVWRGWWWLSVVLPLSSLLICLAWPFRQLLLTQRYRRDFGVPCAPDYEGPVCYEDGNCCEGILTDASVGIFCCPCFAYYGHKHYMSLRQDEHVSSAGGFIRESLKALNVAMAAETGQALNDLQYHLADPELREAVGFLLGAEEGVGVPAENLHGLKQVLCPLLITRHLHHTGQHPAVETVEVAVHSASHDDITLALPNDQCIAMVLVKASKRLGLEHARHVMSFGGIIIHSLSTIHENDIETGAILRIVPLDESGHDPDFLLQEDDLEQFRNNQACCPSTGQTEQTNQVHAISRTPSDMDFDTRGKDLWEAWLGGCVGHSACWGCYARNEPATQMPALSQESALSCAAAPEPTAVLRNTDEPTDPTEAGNGEENAATVELVPVDQESRHP